MKTVAQTYQKSSQDYDREKLILDHIEYVGQILSTMAVSVRDPDDRDNLRSAGMIGLVTAANKFDFREGVKFKTFAFHKIRGAIIDELRKCAPVSQPMLRQIGKLKAAYETLDPPVTPERLCDATDMSYETVEACLEAMRFLQPEGWSDFSEDAFRSRVQQQNDPAKKLEDKELRDILAKSIEELPEKERLIITLYYSDGLNLAEIGKVIDMSESGVSRALATARFRLKEIVRSKTD